MYFYAKWWHPRGGTVLTKKIAEEKGTGGGRKLGGKVIPWPDDVKVDIAINGKIIKTHDKEEFSVWTAEIAYNEAFYPLLDDKDFLTGNDRKNVEVGFRIRSESDPLNAGISFTHVYYA